MRRFLQLQQDSITEKKTDTRLFPEAQAGIELAKNQRLAACDIVALARATLQQESILPVPIKSKRRARELVFFPSIAQAPSPELRRMGLLEPLPKTIPSSESCSTLSSYSLSNSVSPSSWAAARADSVTPNRVAAGGSDLMVQELNLDEFSSYNGTSPR